MPFLSTEGKDLFDQLPPMRQRVAVQMMLSSAHFMGALNIEQVEVIEQDFTRQVAAHFSNLITKNIV
jgi:hypothetical protein